MPAHAVYQKNPQKFSEAEKRRRQSRWPHVSEEELERLRLPENRLESLAYGLAKKQLVCLNCGGIFESNFSRHPYACPMKPRSDYDADGYREQYGFNKSNSLTSAEWHARKSQTLKTSEKFQQAQRRNRPRWLAAAVAERERVSTAKRAGQSIRRAPMRSEGIARRRAAQLGKPRRLRKPSVTQTRVIKVLGRGLTLSKAAEQLGLSPTAVYRRGHRAGLKDWATALHRKRQKLVATYLVALRKHLLANPKLNTWSAVYNWHEQSQSYDGELFRGFLPFLPYLEEEFKRPGAIRSFARDPKNLIPMASCILQRARMAAGQPQESSSEKPTASVAARIEKLSPKKQDLSQYFAGAVLTSRQRECLSLSLEYGLGLAEIAQRLGRNRKTVYEHIESGKRALAREAAAGGIRRLRTNAEQ